MEEKRLFLFLTSIALFLLYFVYDIPASINTSIKFNNKNANAHQIALLYTAYAIPNIISPLIMSRMTKIIKNKILLLLSFFILVGQTIFIAGMKNENLKLSILGRIFLGIGLESYFVYVNNKITLYFIGNELAVAMGLFLAVGRFGTVTTFFINPLLISIFEIKHIHLIGYLLTCIAFSLIIYISKFNKECSESIIEIEENNKKALYLLFQIVFLFGCIWAPFYNIAPLMLQTRFNSSKVHASRYLCYIEGSSIFLGSIIGLFVDHYGKKLYLVLTSGILILTAHLNFLFKFCRFTNSIGLLALAAPMMACYWPCISKVVNKDKLTEVYSLIICIVNVAYTLSPLIVSFLLKYNKDYTFAEEFLSGIAIILIYKLIKLCQLNRREKYGLNEPEIK